MGKKSAVPDGWVGTREAARLLNPDRPLSRERIRQLIEADRLESWRIGHAWLVSRKSIDKRLSEHPPKDM
jgi:excisionase family DNA binding protein